MFACMWFLQLSWLFRTSRTSVGICLWPTSLRSLNGFHLLAQKVFVAAPNICFVVPSLLFLSSHPYLIPSDHTYLVQTIFWCRWCRAWGFASVSPCLTHSWNPAPRRGLGWWLHHRTCSQRFVCVTLRSWVTAPFITSCCLSPLMFRPIPFWALFTVWAWKRLWCLTGASRILSCCRTWQN